MGSTLEITLFIQLNGSEITYVLLFIYFLFTQFIQPTITI